jgi:hypothetical protein
MSRATTSSAEQCSGGACCFALRHFFGAFADDDVALPATTAGVERVHAHVPYAFRRGGHSSRGRLLTGPSIGEGYLPSLVLPGWRAR